VQGLGIASKWEAGRPLVQVVSAEWASGAAYEQGLAGLTSIILRSTLGHAGDRQQDFVTQVHEASARIVTLLGAAGTGAYASAAVRRMDWVQQTRRELIETRSTVDGALLAAVRAVIPATILASGKELAHRIGKGREGEKKEDLTAALSRKLRTEHVDAALAAWAALLAGS